MASHAVIQVFDGPDRPLRREERRLPSSLHAGEVLVAVDLATVCGSDVHTVDGRRREATPAVLGHEGVGRVAALGPGRDGLREGDRVSWSIADSCGRCEFCGPYGLPQKCRRLFKYGHARLDDGCGLNGTYATHVLLRPGTAVVSVPGPVGDDVAAPANCALATAVHAVEQLPENAATVLVQGAGLLGLYACALLADRGVERVFCADPVPGRRALAARFGAVAIDPASAPEARRQAVLTAAPDGVDGVLELAGDVRAVDDGLHLVRPGGVYALVGMVHPDTDLAGITGERIVRKCLTVRGVHNYAPRHLREGVAFLARTAAGGAFDGLVSPPVPLEQLTDAFALSRQRRWLRVAVAPREAVR